MGLILLDYLQLMEAAITASKSYQKLRSLKGLARELNVPLLPISAESGVEAAPTSAP